MPELSSPATLPHRRLLTVPAVLALVALALLIAVRPAAARTALTLTLHNPDAYVTPGVTAVMDGAGDPGQSVQLRCYTRPSTSYVTARTATLDANGRTSFSVRPPRNTRCFLQYAANSTQEASGSVVVPVHTALSLSAARLGPRHYLFRGRALPVAPGQLVALYRLRGGADPIRTATGRVDSSGAWRIDRTFSGTGRFDFFVRTAQTTNNAEGDSQPPLSVDIR